MMRMRQRWLVNAALAAGALLLAGRLVSEWDRGNARYDLLERQSAAGAGVGVVIAPEQPPAPVVEIVAKNLFTPDRSSALQQVAVISPSAPPPVVIGTMQLAGEYEALMAEGGASSTPRFRRVKVGQQVGPHTVVEIRDEAVVVEYQGIQTVVNVYQSAKSVLRAASSAAPAAPRASAAPVVDTVAAPGGATSGTATSPGTAPGGAANTSGERRIGDVTVTIEGNRRRYERWSMFGPQVWYEDIK
jgi:hypothetical protein